MYMQSVIRSPSNGNAGALRQHLCFRLKKCHQVYDDRLDFSISCNFIRPFTSSIGEFYFQQTAAVRLKISQIPVLTRFDKRKTNCLEGFVQQLEKVISTPERLMRWVKFIVLGFSLNRRGSETCNY